MAASRANRALRKRREPSDRVTRWEPSTPLGRTRSGTHGGGQTALQPREQDHLPFTHPKRRQATGARAGPCADEVGHVPQPGNHALGWPPSVLHGSVRPGPDRAIAADRSCRAASCRGLVAQTLGRWPMRAFDHCAVRWSVQRPGGRRVDGAVRFTADNVAAVLERAYLGLKGCMPACENETSTEIICRGAWTGWPCVLPLPSIVRRRHSPNRLCRTCLF